MSVARLRRQRNRAIMLNGILLLLIVLQSLYMSHRVVSSDQTSVKLDFVQKPKKPRTHRYRSVKPRMTAAGPNATDPNTNQQAVASLPVSIPSRIFPKWNLPFPCASWEGKMKRTETTEGFLYLKEIKTGSSTLAGVTIRIARNMAVRLKKKSDDEMCRARFHHLRARKFERRNRTHSFLWTVVRNPTTRLLSKFFHFAVSREGVPATAVELEQYYRAYENWILDHAYYLKTMTLRDINAREVGLYGNYTEMILNDFDFIGTTERFDESLVVLKLLLGLEFGDLLYLSVKSAHSYEFLPQKRACNALVPKSETPDMTTFFASEYWRNYTYADDVVYQAVNQSLERTIESLGQELVARELALFRKAQAMAYAKCAPTTEFPCNELGQDRRKKTDCLFNDSGCGYKCLDELAKELKSIPEFGGG